MRLKRILPVLGYTAAGATLLAVVLVPFVFIDLFTRAFAATGVQIDPAYSGGEVSYVINRGGYKIVVNQPVRPTSPLSRFEPFVQIAWSPVTTLPSRVAEEIDIDRDGRPDVRIEFANPSGPADELRVNAAPESPRVVELQHTGKESFSRAIVRDGDRIVVRVPLAR
jgi:hypothetical protein